MIDKNVWLPEMTAKLRERFGDRLLFVGLQGSYRRGEATEASDFDVMVVLDALSIDDLRAYRAIVKTMPQAEKACGFIGGSGELRNWPKYEIFQLVRETEPVYGDLRGLTPEIGDDDVRDSVRVGVANLYHALCHMYVYDEADAELEALKPAYKSFFFIMQVLHYLRTGDYVETKSALLEVLDGGERSILDAALHWDRGATQRRNDPERCFALLIDWCGEILRTL